MMNRLVSKLPLTAPLIAVSLMLIPAGASAQDSKTVGGGRTTVALSSGFTAALGDLGVTPGTISPTELYDGKVNFPVTSGVIDLKSGALQLLHSGGLILEKGATKVTLSSFIIDTTGAAPVITGLVTFDGKLLGRVTLFDLTPTRGPVVEYGRFELKDVSVSLDAGAAGDLNSIFGVTAFKGGFDIGTANVDAYLHWK